MAIGDGSGGSPLGGPPDTGTETGPEGRNERYHVRLAVRYLEAEDYVLDYAENLSRGGLFVVGAQQLEPLEEVTIRIDLPGFGAYDVTCRVAHTLSEERAQRMGRSPGAGFAIMSAPLGFEQALSRYLIILGGRRDAVVFVSPGPVEQLLRSAGYQVSAAPPPERIADALAAAGRAVGVVLPPAMAPAYRQALRQSGVGDDVIVESDPDAPPDDLLNTLDGRVRALTA